MTAGTSGSALRTVGIGRVLALLVGTAWLGALALALTWLPVLTIARNRLALGDPRTGSEALGATGALVLAMSALAIALVVSRNRAAAALATLLLLLAILAFGQGLGAGAVRSLAGLPPAARASLGSGSWLGLFLLAGALSLAVRRSRKPGFGLAIGLGLGLALVVLGWSGAFDALSLAVEYAARRETVNAALAEHLALAGAALILAGFLAVGLSLLPQGLVALVLGGIQVVPAVALLGGMVAVMSGLLRAVPILRDLGLSALGPVPAIVAIAAYLALPLWRGLTLALRAPDDDTLQAAEALGLSRGQVLARVRLPIGAPILIGAVRVAAVQGLGLATLGALVGAGGLGRIVFDGMAQFAPDLILLGAIPVVVLSLLTERGLSRVEAAARRRWHA
ncbi:ABC transporter permease subunit [Methylobacterium sp. Leaf465]|uniref:ABC transporter permease subunit n=1 Tax=Methylobacterium sp. Leaf465 TaxID=1736385 RepID=UPI0009EBAFB4|nr:ABC transporter permease subunit [Methylobacterium sp. Leaf465]